MKYREFAAMELKLSLLGLGTDQLSGAWGFSFSQESVNRLIGVAEDQGVNHLDTAECYGDHLSEELIGKAIINRDKWIIASKFGHKICDGRKQFSFDCQSVEKQLNDSLKSLQSDYIDIYYFHSGENQHFFNDDLWSFLNKQVAQGKIRCLGLSYKHGLVKNGDYQQVDQAKDVGIQVIQTVCNYLSQESFNYLIPECKKRGLDVIGRMPLARGLLTGKYKSNDDLVNLDPRSSEVDFNEKAFATIQNDLSHIPDEDLSKWAIAWALSHNNVGATIVGCKNEEQLLGNIEGITYST